MDASCPDGAGRPARIFAVAALLIQLAILVTLAPSGVTAQAVAHPVMRGKVWVGDAPLTKGRVVLHHISPHQQGPVDSMRLGRGGSFTFHLPTVPDSSHGDLYFAAVEHDGVLYFGTPIALPIQLDSLYEIHTYDTTMVASRGVALPIEVRNVFLERDSAGAGWRVTDLIEVVNQGKRTLTAPDGGVVWRYPLPGAGSGFAMGQTGFSLDAASFDHDTVVVRAPIPPGPRVFVVRYTVPDPFISIPMPGSTSAMEMLIREPAPTLTVSGLQVQQSVQLEAGSTYRHFMGQNLDDTTVTVKHAAAPYQPPVRWFAVILALLLAGFGIKAFYASRSATAEAEGPGAAPGPMSAQDREALLVEIARLDDDFESRGDPSEEEAAAYAARRAALLERLKR